MQAIAAHAHSQHQSQRAALLSFWVEIKYLTEGGRVEHGGVVGHRKSQSLGSVSFLISVSLAKTKLKESVEIPVLTRCCFCVPLRLGLLAFAYLNLVLTVLVMIYLAYYMNTYSVLVQTPSNNVRFVLDLTALCIETAMTTAFIVALHKKHVLLMKIYLCFEVVFSILGFIYSIATITKETASEVFLILFQLMLQIYLIILIWSSIVKMERDGTVKYTRETNQA
ncbi:hypothetical protein EVAR_81207_1 [Eumeta japonica]|uniref:Uncharacterized protein n=1 Tax=Eumeta variegata TaxID=151549 RepID=A0A4C1V1J6_EUMVA|nr:hypothetical protein EVAR_81207_1 [Eumeta japonica]